MAKPVKHLIIVLFISLLMLSAGTGSAQAATKNGVNRVVSVKQDYAGYPRTDLTIAEDEALYDGIQAGESFELLLPPGVEWAVDASGVATYHSEDIICQNCAVGARLINARTVEITITAADPDAPARLTIPLVFAVEDYLGDIEVTIDSLDSGISGGKYVFARVPYKEVPLPQPDPEPEPEPQPMVQQAVFTIGSPFFSIDGAIQPQMDVEPYIKEGRTYLPVRYVAYSLGIDDRHIQWDAAARRVVLSKGEHKVQIWIGSRALDHNGTLIDMDVAPEIYQQRTMLPVAPIVEAFGGSIQWNPTLRTVTIVVK